MDAFENPPGKRTIAAILGGIAAVAVAGLMLLGGRSSMILSNVGAPIGDPDLRSSGDTSGGAVGGDHQDQPQGGEPNKGQLAGAAATAPELLIIKTGQLTIEVGDLEAAVAAARDRVVAAGGFISGSDQSADGEQATAPVTFRVPAARWDDALAAVQALGAATRSLHVETEAVTNQVVDLGARITNLRSTEAALQKIMEQATKIPDVLDVETELMSVRGEIERLVAEKAHLEEQAAFGTLTVTFVLPVPPVVEEVKAGWDPAADADAATGTLIKLGQRGVSVGIWVAIVGLPVALGVAVIGLIAVGAWRLGRRPRTDAIEP